jgi:DNA-binding transcriptional LysR family regulator
MEMNRLRIFLMVAEELHFRRAAERLHMTQPPVSHAIRKLEEELDAKLFDRHNRKVELTPAGECLQKKGRVLMEHVRRVETAVKRVTLGLEGTLAIGFVGLANALGLPGLIARYHKAYPDVAMSLDEMPTQLAIEKLLTGELDLALIRGEPEDPLDYVTFLEEPYWLALPEDHPLAQHDSIQLRDLDQEPILFFPRSFQPQIYDEWILSFKNEGIRPRFVQEIRSVGAEMGLVAAGVGIALVTETLSKQSREGVVFRTLDGRCPRVEVNIAWHPDRFHETAERFIGMVS